jgi:hypothetical protein
MEVGPANAKAATIVLTSAASPHGKSKSTEKRKGKTMRGSIKKRGKNSWRLIFDLERDHTGKRNQKSLTVRGTKKQAEAELSRKLAEIESGGFINPGNLNVPEYLERCLRHVGIKTSAKTHERYDEIVRLAITPALGTIKLSKLTPMNIQAFYQEALASGHLKRDVGLSARTVLHYHRILFQSLKQAVRWRLLAVTLDLYSHVMPGMQKSAALKVDTALRAALGKRSEEAF